MNTTNRASIKPGKTISTKELAVTANFTNGFAEHVMELTDGTLIYISYNEDRVRIVERELIKDPQEITNVINSTPDEE